MILMLRAELFFIHYLTVKMLPAPFCSLNTESTACTIVQTEGTKIRQALMYGRPTTGVLVSLSLQQHPFYKLES